MTCNFLFEYPRNRKPDSNEKAISIAVVNFMFQNLKIEIAHNPNVSCI